MSSRGKSAKGKASSTVKPSDTAPVKPANEVKYCSTTCRRDSPNKFDRSIELAFLRELCMARGAGSTHRDGVLCCDVEQQVYGDRETRADETPAERGNREARERERVRRAGRRLVAFGVPPHSKLEGVMSTEHDSEILTKLQNARFDCVQEGKPVESSFAKGDWGVRVRS
ncbi:hypothetical protein PYCC9005_002851 [Savitreella phatthalungensis]